MPKPTRKYAPLAAYLSAASGARVTLTLAEITAILGAALPPSARAPNFWANRTQGSAQARAWLAAGWQVGAIHGLAWVDGVTFVRRRVSSAG